jgi:hypothetical protein
MQFLKWITHTAKTEMKQGYIPIHQDLVDKIGLLETVAFQAVVEAQEKDAYCEISLRAMAKRWKIPKSTMQKTLHKLRDKGLINIKKGPGQRLMYRADKGEFCALFGLSAEEGNCPPAGQNCPPQGQNRPQGGQFEQGSLRKEKVQAIKKDSSAFFEDEGDLPTVRKNRWEFRFQEWEWDYPQQLFEAVNAERSHKISRNNFDYVLYYVLDEQWWRAGALGKIPRMDRFLTRMQNFLLSRWTEYQHMWGYDLLSARICDEVGLRRNYTLEVRQQNAEAHRFSSLYLAMRDADPNVEPILQTYFAYLRDRKEADGEEPFTFRECAYRRTIATFDQQYASAAGKQGLLQYFMGREQLTRG